MEGKHVRFYSRAMFGTLGYYRSATSKWGSTCPMAVSEGNVKPITSLLHSSSVHEYCTDLQISVAVIASLRTCRNSHT
jgi:hypothetical protein